MLLEARDYEFRTEPLGHQLEKFLRTADMQFFGDFDEQGTGKSKVAIDLAAYRFLRGEINGVLVVAPSGVQRNWINDELPKHLREDVAARGEARFYKTQNPLSNWQRIALRKLVRAPEDRLSWLAISYDALMTDTGFKLVKAFLTKRRVLFLLDEAHHIKNMGAKRTTRIHALAKYAVVRRAMTGTPVSNGPFDVYSLFEFLQSGFWQRFRMRTYGAFKGRFGVYKTVTMGKGGPNEKSWPELQGYRNVARLRGMVGPYMSRVRKAEVLDLPPKVYTQRYYELAPDQARMYEELATQYQVELGGGRVATAVLPIVRLLRLQQIACGYLPCDDEEPDHRFPTNPRLELLQEAVGDMGGDGRQGIIWARFTPDVDQILEWMAAQGITSVRYDGQVDEDQRERNKFAFKNGDAQWMVGKAVVGKEGLTLNEADVMIYYSNTFSLVDRFQSEDRAHRIGRDGKLLVVDLLGVDTVDWRIVRALRKKEDLASQLTGDQLRDWIQKRGEHGATGETA